MPWVVVSVDRLGRSVPKPCAVAIRHGISGMRVEDPEKLRLALRDEPCCYAGRDWARRSRVVVAAVRAVGGEFGAALIAYVRAQEADPDVQRDACELVEDGMSWAPGLHGVSGGEHRLCAMRTQGVSEVVVFTG